MVLFPPLYMVGAKILCWNCPQRMPVIALLASRFAEPGYCDDVVEEVCMLSEIRLLPDGLLANIQERVPTFQIRYSKTGRTRFYTNTCPRCEKAYGDSHLSGGLGSLFMPSSREEAEVLYLTQIPTSSEVFVSANPIYGPGDLILRYGRQIP